MEHSDDFKSIFERTQFKDIAPTTYASTQALKNYALFKDVVQN
jgi:hypothetical protein